MAEVHAGTAAGVDGVVFALAADTWWRHGSTENLRPRWSWDWRNSAMPAGRVFVPRESVPALSGSGSLGSKTDSPRASSKRKVAAPGAEWVVDAVFTDSERERVAALWRLTVLPRAEFDAICGDML